MTAPWFDSFSAQEQAEIQFSQVWLEEFEHDTPCSLHYGIIAKLAEMLSVAQDTLPELMPEYDSVLAVPYHSQHEDDARRFSLDCGPACIEMVGEYWTADPSPSTDEIMNWITGATDRCTYIVELQRAANHFYGIELERHDGAGWEDLLGWIDEGLPSIVLGRYGAFVTRQDRGWTGGHFFVIVGYDSIDYQGAKVERILLHDPDFYPLNSSTDTTAQGAFIPVVRSHFEHIWSTCHLNGNPNNLALVARG